MVKREAEFFEINHEQLQQIVLIISKTKMIIVLDIQKEKTTCISSRC
ncbi:hypothetical protein SMU89_08922 [Streptococcus mutans NLML1]|nr:hypothetical protein SMU89_08922 [Streptococcus mutans NLML1]